MKSVLIRLEGPIQSWGTQGRFSIRDTDTEPSKSGVIGLVAAALGMPRDQDATVAQLAMLEMAVRVDQEGSLLCDYHTAGGGVFRGKPHAVWGTSDPVPTRRYYLCDASFLVALGGENHPLVERIAEGLGNPVWPLFLGRKSCTLSKPPLVGLRTETPAMALRAEPLPEGVKGPIRLVVESEPGDGVAPRNDVPLSFTLYHRRHARRFVRREWIQAINGPKETRS